MAKRGPKTLWSDEALLEKIQQVRGVSPFHTEGYRKMWARLRRLGIYTSRKRVLRIMRAANLLQPPSTKTGKFKLALERRLGCITTTAPNVIWGFDSTELLTESGRVLRLFVVIEHWNSEIIAWWLTIDDGAGPARAVIELAQLHSPNAARSSVSMRLDHWEILKSQAFTSWLSTRGIEPFFIFPMQPEGNGVAERFFKTLKNEIPVLPHSFGEAYGFITHWLADYNQCWLLERLKYRSPIEMRRGHKPQHRVDGMEAA